MLAIQEFNDPYMAENYLGCLQECPNSTISRSNLKMADAKIAMGRMSEAIAYLEKDILSYPISIEALYKKAKIEEKIGRTDAMRLTLNRLARALEYKGLSAEDAPVIANYSYFDNKFEEYKKLKQASGTVHKNSTDRRKIEKAH
jgi:tetratricopeptide (TPR) repeat protein